MNLKTGLCLIGLVMVIGVKAQVQANRNGYVHPLITVQSGTNQSTAFNLSFYKGADTFIVTQNTGSWYLGQDSGLSWAQPLVIINATGKKIIVNGGINTENLQYVEIIGFGSDSAYGFEFRNGGVTGVFQGMQKGLRIRGCRFTGGSQGGVWIKEPSPHACDYLNYYTNVDTDPAHAKYRDPYQYLAVGNKPYDSIIFRHNMVDSCGGDAVYLLGTDADGRDECPCLPVLGNGTRKYASPFGRNINADSNYITVVGRSALQVSKTEAGVNTIIGNKIYNIGYEWSVTGGNEALAQGAGIRHGWKNKNMKIWNNSVIKTFLYNYDISEPADMRDNYGDSVGRVFYNGHITNNPQPLPSTIIFANNSATYPMILRSNTMKNTTAGSNIAYAIYGGNKFLSSGNDTCFNIGKITVLSTPFNANPTCSGGGTDTLCHDSTYILYYDSSVTTTITKPIFYDSTVFKNDTSYWRALKLNNPTHLLTRINRGTYVTYHLSRDTTYDTTFTCTNCASKDTTVQVCIITGGSAMNKGETNELDNYAWNYKYEMKHEER
jgi:hypothetical protein